MARARAAAPAAPIAASVETAHTDNLSAALTVRLLDTAILIAFLGLAFLLGVFPLNDTDFWWHLRTGDLIRQTGRAPVIDPFLFGGPTEKPWIDLHWTYQVLLSLGYERGGVDLLTVAKCAITTFAIAIVFLARRAGSPTWVMALAWIPALLLLAGRMYVRPETLTLLYLISFLAILSHWEERPRLAWLLPPIQLLWVNSQGLFVLGLGLVGFALANAALKPGAFAADRRGWWRFALGISSATAAVCLVNPYGLQGALFPFQLLGTMSNPVFSESIAELEPVPSFIRRAGWGQPSIRIYLATLALGGLSFLLPVLWTGAERLRRRATLSRTAAPKPSAGRSKKRAAVVEKSSIVCASGWRPSVFRLLLFVSFSLLSWKATRNSQQFAAVVGALTAWNLAEWAAAVGRARRQTARVDKPTRRSFAGSVVCRLATLGVLIALTVFVATGAYYTLLGEGRTVGLGEKPLWFPHKAVEFARGAGMPERFVCIHNGHAAVWEYHNGPERKVYTDARLEVIGPELYKEYLALQQAIRENRGWEERLAAMGNPGLLLDLVQTGSPALSASIFSSPNWRCIFFDAVAAVFVHRSYTQAGPAVDFRRRHFGPADAAGPAVDSERLAFARILRDLGGRLISPGGWADAAGRTIAPAQPERAAPLLLLGRGLAHRVLENHSRSPEAWKLIGQIETTREPSRAVRAAQRYRMPFDPLIDLPTVRATRALNNSLRGRPDDFSTMASLIGLYQARGMDEVLLPWVERLIALPAINEIQRRVQGELSSFVLALRSRIQAPDSTAWKNRSELERLVTRFLDLGRVETAAELLETSYRPESRSWEITEQIATLRLHLGDTSGARRIWEEASAPPRPALRDSRIALTYLCDEDFEPARRHVAAALAAEPALFEALFLGAILESDAGDRAKAEALARRALGAAPGALAESAVQRLLRTIGPEAPAPAGNPEDEPPHSQPIN